MSKLELWQSSQSDALPRSLEQHCWLPWCSDAQRPAIHPHYHTRAGLHSNLPLERMGIKAACLLLASCSTPGTMFSYGSWQIFDFWFSPLICPHAATVHTKEEQKLFAWSSQSQHLPGLWFSRKREKSHSTHKEHSEKWTGTWIKVFLYPLSTTNPFISKKKTNNKPQIYCSTAFLHNLSLEVFFIPEDIR